jgi:hypothetical protein
MANPRLGASACGKNSEYERESRNNEARKYEAEPSTAKPIVGEVLTRSKLTGRNENSSVRIIPMRRTWEGVSPSATGKYETTHRGG